MQKKDSVFLCVTGIRYYYNFEREIYEKFLKPRLSAKWQHETLGIQFREIAHSIRNQHNNPRHNNRRDIDRIGQANGGNMLFPVVETVETWRLEQAGRAHG
jgi:hypothetical protein